MTTLAVPKFLLTGCASIVVSGVYGDYVSDSDQVRRLSPDERRFFSAASGVFAAATLWFALIVSETATLQMRKITLLDRETEVFLDLTLYASLVLASLQWAFKARDAYGRTFGIEPPLTF